MTEPQQQEEAQDAAYRSPGRIQPRSKIGRARLTVKRQRQANTPICLRWMKLLEKTDTESQIPLGTIEIPLDYVVGTKTTGRTPAFASNFMPLLPENTEFASKWVSLCMAHVEEHPRCH